MAEDKVEPRELNLRQWLPWTVLFRGFQVAMDPKKLLLAAAGIVVMSFGWWLLAVVFFSPRTKRQWDSGRYDPQEYAGSGGDAAQGELNAWRAFKRHRQSYNLLYKAAAPSDLHEKLDAGDLARTLDEYRSIDAEIKAGKTV